MFERFIRAIRICNNLSDARRFRSEVSSQLKREARVEGQDQTYLRRLETGKRILDQKVTYLAAGGSSKGLANQVYSKNGAVASRLEKASLLDVLHDTAGLSYFMEYMDRQRLMTLVQFWIVVDGIRNPLEDDNAEEEDLPMTAPSWTESDRADIAQINDAYLSRPELKVPDQARDAVQTFLKQGRNATPQQYQKARSAILRIQSASLEEMQTRYFPKFKKSDLFYKYLTSDESTTTQPPMSTTSQPISSLVKHPHSMSRAASSKSSIKSNHLHRSAASATDLKSSALVTDENVHSRRSLDGEASSPLFDDDYDTDPLTRSFQSIDTDPGSPEAPDRHVVEAMEAALNDIMEEAPKLKDSQGSLLGATEANERRVGLTREESVQGSGEFGGADLFGVREKEKPSIASLGLVGTTSRFGVFSDDDLFSDEERFLQDEHDDSEVVDPEDQYDEIHEAAPGDLGLAEAITALTADINRLVAQDSVVDSLTKKAELTNNTAELRILRKSKASLQREIRTKELQKQQYIVQESDNSLYGRSTVKIKSIAVGREDDGHEFALCRYSPLLVPKIIAVLTLCRRCRSSTQSWRADSCSNVDYHAAV